MPIKQLSLNSEQMLDFQQWKKANSEDFSLWDYLSAVANVELALAFSKLFWPDFVEHEGGIFLSEAFDLEIYQEWKAKLSNDLTAIERAMNHQHLDDLFPVTEKCSIDNLYYLGQTIKQIWESRLKSVYRDRHFQVCCDWDGDTVVLLFYQSPTADKRR